MYDIIVIGGGHAGIEAALASARRGFKTALYTMSIHTIGEMPCNPSVGGPAKGIVVREIDALGGEMAKAADKTAIQFKMLNSNKGPGVQSLRVQSDKVEYAKYMQTVCLNTPNLTVVEEMVEEVLVENHKITGILTKKGEIVPAKIVILTSGTFMDAKILIGHTSESFGPNHQPTTKQLSNSLRNVGFKTFRLKTGTPPRIDKHTIDFSKAEVAPGNDDCGGFSYATTTILPIKQQEVCHLIHTAPTTHTIINDNLSASAMYSGKVESVGPRYCPSIEDKLVRFADKERHQIFLEPESKSLDTIYIQGFSTSMPKDIQEEMVKSLPGLENAKIIKYAYAIEYDAIDPLQMKKSLESKLVENLFTAGQINGTSGYEEAAGQGLMAGINATLKLENKPPLILGREEAYIGVMIDDLTTKGTQEPYRLLTSRAEYRLLLRHDNADQRLIQYGYDLNLISEEAYQNYLTKIKQIAETKNKLSEIRFTPKSEINTYLHTIGYETLKEGISALELLKRPYTQLLKFNLDFPIDPIVANQIEIDVKYEGYIEKAKKNVKQLQKLEAYKLSETIDYSKIENLSLEARQKLNLVKPTTIGQASRISGINPSDINVLLIHLKQHK